MRDTIIHVENVSKKFCRNLKRSLWYGLKDLGSELTKSSNSNKELRKHEFWALKDISFELKRGDTLGLIGSNGAGKTTLLRMLNGLIRPDGGRIRVRGRMQALIALGAGFNPILTGRENIYVNASVLGIKKKEINKKFDQIVEFSGIGDFIDAPVQTYSSGMAVRLGFSVAAHMEPDILLVDEVLAVGDFSFQTQCIKKIKELIDNQTSIILVSHNLDLVYNTCRQTVYLNNQQVEFLGSTEKAIECYRLNQEKDYLSINGQNYDTSKSQVLIFSTSLLDKTNNSSNIFRTGEPFAIEFTIQTREIIYNPVIGIGIHRVDGIYVTSFNSKVYKQKIPSLNAKCKVKLAIESLPLTEGYYTISIAINTQDSLHNYCYMPKFKTFKVVENFSYKIHREHGVVHLPCRWEVSS